MPLEIPEGGGGMFSPDGQSIVYTPIDREFRTWKRYRGGRAQDVWTYDLKQNTSKRITKFVGTDHHPMWHKDKIYFVSDRDLKLNIWCYDLKTEKFNQITTHKDYDVLWPSGHNGLIAYENGGFIYKLDLSTGKINKIAVHINFDNPNTIPYFKNVSKFISRFGYNISPSGKRAVFDARGDIFTVPEKKGITYNLTKTQGVREMYPAWSPDGKWIAYYSDQTDAYEIYLLDPKGKKNTVQLTQNHKIWKFPVTWSPDSKQLLFFDKNLELQILNINTKKITMVDNSKESVIEDYVWSNDSKWITYSKNGKNGLSNIWVYSLEKNKTYQLLDKTYQNFAPTFSKNGQFIYFLSNRDFNMNFQTGFSSMEFDFVYNKTARMYAVALTKTTPKLFKDENDIEEGIKEKADIKKEEKADKKKEKESKKESIPIKIDFDGIDSRVIVFPISTGNFGMVQDLGDKILYFKDGGLHLFDIKKKKSELFIKGIRGGSISSNGKKLLYRAKGKFGITSV
jgi:tricorn protease